MMGEVHLLPGCNVSHSLPLPEFSFV
jgi:hypothetical protein